jgi:hypothetical protein
VRFDILKVSARASPPSHQLQHFQLPFFLSFLASSFYVLPSPGCPSPPLPVSASAVLCDVWWELQSCLPYLTDPSFGHAQKDLGVTICGSIVCLSEDNLVIAVWPLPPAHLHPPNTEQYAERAASIAAFLLRTSSCPVDPKSHQALLHFLFRCHFQFAFSSSLAHPHPHPLHLRLHFFHPLTSTAVATSPNL